MANISSRLPADNEHGDCREWSGKATVDGQPEQVHDDFIERT